MICFRPASRQREGVGRGAVGEPNCWAGCGSGLWSRRPRAVRRWVWGPVRISVRASVGRWRISRTGLGVTVSTAVSRSVASAATAGWTAATPAGMGQVGAGRLDARWGALDLDPAKLGHPDRFRQQELQPVIKVSATTAVRRETVRAMADSLQRNLLEVGTLRIACQRLSLDATMPVQRQVAHMPTIIYAMFIVNSRTFTRPANFPWHECHAQTSRLVRHTKSADCGRN